MRSKASSRPVGVIGAGQFGVVIAQLLAEKGPVLLYTRSKERSELINSHQQILKQPIHPQIRAVCSLEEIAQSCRVIFPVVPAAAFPSLIEALSIHLHPSHILIHAIKGFCLRDESLTQAKQSITKKDILTISQIIEEKTSVLRIGCISGPNISQEIAKKLPTATIIASRYKEVITEGQRLLRNNHFLVYGSLNLIGTELCGALKNVIAIAAGLIDSLQLGNNAKAVLISRGMVDIISIGKILGAAPESFLGIAGIGDIITSCFSPMSRNFTIGKLLAQNKSITEAIQEVDSTAEGVRTVEIIVKLAQHYKIRCLLAEILHKIMQQEMSIPEANQLLMRLPFSYDSYTTTA